MRELLLLADQENLEIAHSLIHEIEKIGSEYRVIRAGRYCTATLKEMPKVILDDLTKSQVSIFCCNSQTGELGSRVQMISVVTRTSCVMVTW